MQIVVQEWERVLMYRNGRFEESLGAGRHRARAGTCVGMSACIIRPRRCSSFPARRC